MKIKESLQELLTYYLDTRKSGHTALMKVGTNNYEDKKFVVCHNYNHGKSMDFNDDEIISFQHLIKLRGNQVPIAIDNGTMITILEKTINEIERLEKDNEKMTTALQLINRFSNEALK